MKNWKDLRIGDHITWEVGEFMVTVKLEGIITEVHDDHAIAQCDDVTIWIDGDTTATITIKPTPEEEDENERRKTMKKNKEHAIQEFMVMIRKSWTYGKMTAEEQDRWENTVAEWSDPRLDGHIRGNYADRWRQCQAIYNAYLAGLGYDGPHWRDEEGAPF